MERVGFNAHSSIKFLLNSGGAMDKFFNFIFCTWLAILGIFATFLIGWVIVNILQGNVTLGIEKSALNLIY